MWVGDELFTAASGHSKLKKCQRHLYLDELANTITTPDEIYLEAETLSNGKSRIVKKMLRYFKTEDGKDKALMAIFEYREDKTLGVSAYVVEGKDSIERKRTKRLVYKKGSDGPGN